jgi:ABC-type multidrug transport system fused ATPase/permease subunit
MTSSTLRQARQHAIERQATRLEQKISTLKILSNRISWVRAGIFVAALVLTLVIGTQVNGQAALYALAAASLLFILVVLYHRHLEHWLATFTIWRDIRSDQIKRMNLDWAELPAPAPLDPRTKNSLAFDLDLTGARSLHQLLDTTISRQGSQLLADWLTQAKPNLVEIAARQSVVRELVPLSRFRDHFLLTFRLVLQEQLKGEDLLYWLGIEFPSRRLRWTLPVASVLIAANLVLAALYLLANLPPFWLITLGLYIAFYLFNLTTLDTVLGAVVRVDTELDKFGAIIKYLEYSKLGHSSLAQLCAPFRDRHHSPSAQIRTIKAASFGVGLRSNPVLGLVLNLVLPWDFLFAFAADRFRAQVIQSFPVWAQVCYQIDALIALANFGFLNPDYVFPEIEADAKPVFHAEGLGHPLITPQHRVYNDFTIDAPGELAIITGSNMAGKSSFIKTVGINLCLAYAGAPINATRFRSAPFRLYSCVRISDSIVDGFSYFYAEVRCLKGLLEELKSDDRVPLLYLIDEIFRGTNNRERLLGGRAYLRDLIGENAVGLLATHDLELARLEENSTQVHNYHFRDRVLENKLVFDYKIQPGVCPTTNALKIMQMEGLPVDTEE